MTISRTSEFFASVTSGLLQLVPRCRGTDVETRCETVATAVRHQSSELFTSKHKLHESHDSPLIWPVNADTSIVQPIWRADFSFSQGHLVVEFAHPRGSYEKLILWTSPGTLELDGVEMMTSSTISKFSNNFRTLFPVFPAWNMRLF